MIDSHTLELIRSDLRQATEWMDQAEQPDITDEQTVMYAQLSMARTLLAIARQSVAAYPND